MKEERSFHQPSDSQSIFDWGGATHVGNIRTQNQDFFGTSNPLLAVADGMGGHNGGEIASETAIKELLHNQKFTTIQELAEQVTKVNETVKTRAEGNPVLFGMGTTLCALAYLPKSSKVGIVNVGDSRIYILADQELHQITQDHSLVEEMHREGKITKLEAQHHPHRNVITRSIGTHDDVLVDFWEINPREGDRYLLCTDGLTNELSDQEIKKILCEVSNPQKASEELIKNAISAEGLDNVTAVVVDIIEGKDQSSFPKIPKSPTTYRKDSFLLESPDPNVFQGSIKKLMSAMQKRWTMFTGQK